jgi:hypothetical protein
MDKSTEDVRERIGDNLNEIREELGERAQEIRETVGNYVDAHPLTAVGIAFGVGYLLSGALFSRTTFKAAHIGARFAFGALLKQLVTGIGPGLFMAAMSGRAAQQPEAGGNGNGNKSTQR